jgi:hypothetical protein
VEERRGGTGGRGGGGSTGARGSKGWRLCLLVDIMDKWGIRTAHRRTYRIKNPISEQIQARKVKARLRVLHDAQRVSDNVSQTWGSSANRECSYSNTFSH